MHELRNRDERLGARNTAGFVLVFAHRDLGGELVDRRTVSRRRLAGSFDLDGPGVSAQCPALPSTALLSHWTLLLVVGARRPAAWLGRCPAGRSRLVDALGCPPSRRSAPGLRSRMGTRSLPEPCHQVRLRTVSLRPDMTAKQV